MTRRFIHLFMLTMGLLLPFISCDKRFEEIRDPGFSSLVYNPLPGNAPIANAGPDITIGQVMCPYLRFTLLDGSRSYDPDSNSLRFHWTKISGPADVTLSNNGDDTAIYIDIRTGLYVFELIVTNSKGSASRDTMMVDARNWSLPEHDLDIDFTGTYEFYDNRVLGGWDTSNYYQDVTVINATGSVAPFGQFNLRGTELTDTSYTSTGVNSSGLAIETTGQYPSNRLFIAGPPSVVFKELIQNGGGSFTGTVTVNGGSAQHCLPGIYSNLIPLTISGSLDTTTHMVTINIRGKTFF